MIEIKDLYQWIQPNTCGEIIGMNPTALEDAYVSAIGYLAGEIGNIYDLEEMLPVMKDVHPDLFFMVRVLTASAFMGSTFAWSTVFTNQYNSVMSTIHRMKSGTSRMTGAVNKPEPNAIGKIVTNINDYIG